MNNRIGILITGAAAVVALIALAVLVAWSLRTETVDGSVEPSGSLLHPQVRQDAPPGYVIAELYQDGRLDLESGVYDGDGTLRGSHWTHHDVRQTCSVDLALAVQEGRDQASPTATPRPTHTPLPTDPPWNPEEYAVVERTIDTDNGAGIAVALLPTPRAGWPASTPRPTYTPYPTTTPSPLVSSVSWIGWAGRPIAIAADGVAILDLPRDATVSAHLSVWTGPHQTGQTQLARLPLPDAPWSEGTAHLRLQEASGRLLLASDHIDAHHRSARLNIQAGPLSDCHGLHLRWQQPAAIVVRALTEQPYADWADHPLPPMPVPSPATLSGLTLTGMTLEPAFDPSTTAYSATVPFRTATTTVRPVLAHLSETYEINLGGVRQSDNAPAVIPLTAGVANAIPIVVTSADRNTTKTYTVTVTRTAPSTDATLAGLTLGGTSPDEWTPVFAPDVYDYDVRVPHSAVRTAVEPHTSHAAATFIVSTDPAEALTDSGYGSALVELTEGATTTVTITVTAQDGSTQDYVVRVHRAGP